MTDDRVLQEEPGRLVVVEPGGATVRKSFTDGKTTAARQAAAREFDHLARYHAALAGSPRARCPRPVELSTTDPPSVRMERVAGSCLAVHLARERLTDPELECLATVVVDALLVYVRTFAEPYYDLHLRNTALDPASGVVTFFDFGVPDAIQPDLLARMNRLAPLDVSLGNLLASTVFEAMRPRGVLRLRRHRQSLRLVEKVLAIASAIDVDHQPSPERPVVEWVAAAVLRSLTAERGLWRTAWYRTVNSVHPGPGQLLMEAADSHRPPWQSRRVGGRSPV